MMMITFHWNGFFSIDVWCFVWCSLDVDKERAEACFLDYWKSIQTLHCRCVLVTVIWLWKLCYSANHHGDNDADAGGGSGTSTATWVTCNRQYLVSWVPLQRNNVTATVQAVAALIFPDTHTDRPTVVCRRLQLWVAWVGRF